MESREDLEHRDAANKGPMSTSSRGNDHIHAFEQAVEMENRSEDVGPSSPDQIQHETNPSVNNPIYDKPASPLYPSLPGEPSGVALGEKTNDTKPSKSELSYNPVKRQQVSHVNEAFQESDVADVRNQDNGSNSSLNNADGPETLEPKKASNESPVSNFKVQPKDEKQNVAGQSSADTYNGEHESRPKSGHSTYYLPKGQSPQDTTSC